MAKKKEEQLSYLQMPLPEGQKSSRVVKVNWSGLNLRQTMDTGALSYEKNISTKEAPYLAPSGKFEQVFDFGEVPHTEYVPVSEQGDYSSEDGILYDKNKTKLILVPPCRTRKVILPDSVTQVAKDALEYCQNPLELVLPKGETEINIAKYDFDCIESIIIPEGVTRIARGGNSGSFRGLKRVRIPKSVKYIDVYSLPDHDDIVLDYQGTEEEWDDIRIGRNMVYWHPDYLDNPNCNVSYDDVYEESQTDASNDENTDEDYFTVDENGILTGYTGSGGNVKIPAEVGGTAVKSIPNDFMPESSIIKLSIPSTVISINSPALGSLQGLETVNIYASEIETGTTSVDVGTQKGVYIYGYNGLLAVIYYLCNSGTIDKGKLALSVFDDKFEKISLGDDTKNYVSGDVYLNEIPQCMLTSFSVYDEDNIANTQAVNEDKMLLIFPGNYSLKHPNIVDTEYRYDYRYNSIYPWAFIDDFVDRDCVYNVVLKKGGHSIPADGDIKNPNYLYYSTRTVSNAYRLTENVVLGLWIYDKESIAWVPYGYHSSTDEKDSYAGEEAASFDTEENPCPVFDDVTVFQSRLFGIDKAKVYASEFNNYCGWALDTAEDSNSANAWISALSANPDADGDMKAIVTYQDRVIIFRENYMYEVRNTKNPFRVVDIFQEGCIGREAVCVVEDKLIFANRNGVKVYTGAKPQEIGLNLNIERISYAVCGTDGRRLYLYCGTDKAEHNLFVYDNMYGQWSVMETDKKILCFTNNDSKLFMLADDNKIYKLNEENYDHDWACETDFYTGGTIDIKHIRKIQIYADVDVGSSIKVSIIYDSNADDNTVVYDYVNTGEAMKKIPIRVLPRKSACYGYKIRIEGHGYARVYQMEITLTGGGELYNGGE